MNKMFLEYESVGLMFDLKINGYMSKMHWNHESAEPNVAHK